MNMISVGGLKTLHRVVAFSPTFMKLGLSVMEEINVKPYRLILSLSLLSGCVAIIANETE